MVMGVHETLSQESPSLYEAVKKSIEENWPDWKIQLANDEILTSKHSIKLRTKTQKGREE